MSFLVQASSASCIRRVRSLQPSRTGNCNKSISNNQSSANRLSADAFKLRLPSNYAWRLRPSFDNIRINAGLISQNGVLHYRMKRDSSADHSGSKWFGFETAIRTFFARLSSREPAGAACRTDAGWCRDYKRICNIWTADVTCWR
jgi:hypothetical protein